MAHLSRSLVRPPLATLSWDTPWSSAVWNIVFRLAATSQIALPPEIRLDEPEAENRAKLAAWLNAHPGWREKVTTHLHHAGYRLQSH